MSMGFATVRRPPRGPRSQRGAVAVMVGASLVVLIIALGLVVDLGHMYIAKTELQNAADACALAAVRELDQGVDAGTRATSVGKLLASRNSFDLQGDPVLPESVSVAFSETGQPDTFGSGVTAATRYVRCIINQQGRRGHWFIPVARLLGSDTVAEWDMQAEAVARLVPGQTFCAIPLAMCRKKGEELQVGTWYSGRLGAGTTQTGNYQWIRFSERQGTRDLSELLAGEGLCDIPPEDTLVDAEPGISGGAAMAWNTRFGLYAGGYRDIERYPPDRTGYAYTPASWTAQRDAYESKSDPARDFLSQRDGCAPYNPAEAGIGRLPGSPSPATCEQHRAGGDRRRVLQPVIQCEDWEPNKKNIRVIKWACSLMLQPIADPNNDVRLEFLGYADNGACATFGTPGGAGALVPALVQ